MVGRIILILVFIYSSSKAQELPEITHPTPNVMAFNKYGMAPPSLFTGTPNISIPIYTVTTENGFQLPISLVYSASGLKVDEIASNVGLGWALSAGGNITRVVKGKDGFGYGGFPSGSQLPEECWQRDLDKSIFNPNNYGSQNDSGTKYPDYYYARSLFALRDVDEFDVSSYYSQGASMARIDGEPDMFSYSLPTGESGKFYFDQQFTPILVSRRDLKTVASPGGGWFKITDSQGNEFSFEPGDYSSPVGIRAYLSPPTVSWKLVKIKTYRNNEIALIYKQNNYNYVSANHQVKYIRYPGFPSDVIAPKITPQDISEKIYSSSLGNI